MPTKEIADILLISTGCVGGIAVGILGTLVAMREKIRSAKLQGMTEGLNAGNLLLSAQGRTLQQALKEPPEKI